MKRGVWVFALFILAFANFCSAAHINDSIPIQIQALTDAGAAATGTFTFKIEISNSPTCSPILYTNTTTLTTDARGIVSYNLENVDLDFDEQYWFCYYRDNVLKATIKAARVPYAFSAKSVDASGVNPNSNLNLGTYNVSAGYFIGDGSQLTGISGGDNIWINVSGTATYSGNVNVTNNITASWFKGFFNWIVGDNWNLFDGSTLTFNETKLNETISLEGIRLGFNSSSGESFWTNNSNNISYSLGNVGIGTDNPSAPLEINSSSIIISKMRSTINYSSVSGPFLSMIANNGSIVTNGARLGGFTIGGTRTSSEFNSIAIVGFASENWGAANSGADLVFETTLNGGSIRAEKMRITNAGNVGIGTTTPQNKLNVVGDLNVTGTIYGTVSSSNVWNRSSTNVFLTNTGDNVGIGTSTPGAKLTTVQTGAGIQGGAIANLSNAGLLVGTTSDGIGIDSNEITKLGEALNFVTGDDNPIVFYTNKTQKMTLLSNGNLGIGTSTPALKLTVSSTSNDIADFISSNTSKGLRITSSSSSSLTSIIGYDGSAYNNLDIRTTAGFGSQLYLGTNGNVGIGTSAPGAKLDVNGNIVARYNVTGTMFSLGATSDNFTPSGGIATTHYGLTRESFGVNTVALSGYNGLGFFTLGTEQMRITTAGNVGIGVTSPSTQLQTSNSISIDDTYDYTEFSTKSWSGNHVILFGAYESAQQYDGPLTTLGNTKYRRDVGLYSYGAGAISYYANGGTMDFFISPYSTGEGTNVSWGTPVLRLTRGGNITANGGTFFVDASANNVGIGTTTPRNKLNVVGDLNVTGTIYGTVSSSNVWNRSSTNVFLANIGDEVGIGTSSPNAKLEVVGDTILTSSGNIGLELRSTAAGGTPYIDFSNGSTAYNAPDFSGRIIWNTDRFGILGGNVGIGTASPTNLFVVTQSQNTDTVLSLSNVNTGTSARARLRLENANGNLNIMTASSAYTGTSSWANKGIIGTDSTLDGLVFYTAAAGDNISFDLGSGGTTDVIFTGAGNVGIGTTNPNAKLEIADTTAPSIIINRLTAGNSAIDFQNPSGAIFTGLSTNGYYSIGTSADLTLNPFFTINATSGNVGIGLSNPLGKLQVYDESSIVHGRTVPFNMQFVIEGTGSAVSNYNEYLSRGMYLDGAGTTWYRYNTYASGSAIKFGEATNHEPYISILMDKGNTDSGSASVSEVMRVTQSGLFGIGTNSPSGLLHVNGSFYTSTGKIIIESQDATTEGGELNLLGAGSNLDSIIDNYAGHLRVVINATERMRISSAGRVGIGEDTPAVTLHVSSPGGSEMLRIEDTGASSLTDANPYLLFKGYNTNLGYLGYGSGTTSNLYLTNYLNADLIFSTNSTEKMRVTSSGNVGIGTTNPTAPLHISSTSPFITFTDTDTNSAGYISGSSATGSLILSADAQNTVASSTLVFNIDGSAKAIIDSMGDVGIGTTNPTSRLQIGTGAVNQQWTGGVPYVLIQGIDNEAATPALVIQDENNLLMLNVSATGDSGPGHVIVGGRLGVNNTAPSVALDVIGDIEYTGSITDVSDIRLKSNVAKLNNSLAKMMNLTPISFNMINSTKIEYGLSAQEVQKYFPEIVKEIDNEGHLGISYVSLISPMIKSMQEQQEIIEQQNDTIEEMKTSLCELGIEKWCSKN